MVARAEIERRLKEHTAPNFLATFLREKWQSTLAQLYLQEGEESEAWSSALSTLDDLVWSVQPKRATDDRKKLVAMLRNLLRRLHGGLHNVAWEPGEREQFMSNLGRGARGGGEVEPGVDPDADDGRVRSGRGGRGGSLRERRCRGGEQGARARRGHGARPAAAGTRARTGNPAGPLRRNRRQPRARHVGRVRRRGRPACLRQAGVGQSAARDVPVHQPPGTEGGIAHRRRAGRAFPQRPRAAGGGRAADRPRIHQHDGDDRGEVRQREA